MRWRQQELGISFSVWLSIIVPSGLSLVMGSIVSIPTIIILGLCSIVISMITGSFLPYGARVGLTCIKWPILGHSERVFEGGDHFILQYGVLVGTLKRSLTEPSGSNDREAKNCLFDQITSFTACIINSMLTESN